MRWCALLVCMFSLAAGAQAPGQPENQPAPPGAYQQEEVQALANDVARMRTILRQMEFNLALVQTTQTPLKHQFDLEIDMWRVVLDGMERRLQRMKRSTGGAVSPETVPLGKDPRRGGP